MKTVLKLKESKNPFPKLMIAASKTVVAFTEPQIGTVLYKEKKNVLFEHSECWNMEMFKDFDGIVKLSND